MNLFDLEGLTGGIGPSPGATKPRAATGREVLAYMLDVAARAGFPAMSDHFDLIGGNGSARGIMIGCELEHARYEGRERIEAVYSDGSVCIPMPGYGGPATVTVELLDDQGEVTRTIQLPAKPNGALAFDKADAIKWTGLAPVRGKRSPKPAPVPERVAEPLRQPETSPKPVEPDRTGNPHWAEATERAVLALMARVTELEAIISAPSNVGAKVIVPVPVAANDQGRAPRTIGERRAILRAWAMRGQLRAARYQRDEADAYAENAARAARADISAALDLAQENLDCLTVAENKLTALQAEYADFIRMNSDIMAQYYAQTSAADKRLHALQVAKRASDARAERMVSIAVTHKKAATRLKQDLRGTTAEARALRTRLSALQDAIAASPAAASVINRKLEAA